MFLRNTGTILLMFGSQLVWAEKFFWEKDRHFTQPSTYHRETVPTNECLKYQSGSVRTLQSTKGKRSPVLLSNDGKTLLVGTSVIDVESDKELFHFPVTDPNAKHYITGDGKLAIQLSRTTGRVYEVS